MDDKQWAILGADLRNRLIPCGDCSFDEEHTMSDKQPDHVHEPPDHIVQQLARHEAWIHEIRDTSTRMIAEQGRDVKWIRDTMEKLGATIEKIDTRQDHMEQELAKHNNFQARLRTLEETRDVMPEEFVPRQEFQGTINSVRENVKEKIDSLSGRFALLMWVIGAGFGITFTAIGFMIWGA